MITQTPFFRILIAIWGTNLLLLSCGPMQVTSLPSTASPKPPTQTKISTQTPTNTNTLPASSTPTLTRVPTKTLTKIPTITPTFTLIPPKVIEEIYFTGAGGGEQDLMYPTIGAISLSNRPQIPSGHPGCEAALPNQQLTIIGQDFKPNINMFLGFYVREGGSGFLVYGDTVFSDESGRIKTDISIDTSFPVGQTLKLVVFSYPENLQFGLAGGTQPGPSICIRLPARWQACPNAVSRLEIRDVAYVNYTPPQANRVRAASNTDGDIIGHIQPGETMKILDGPKCENGWVWWYVEALSSGLRGWTSEGNGDEFWLVPLRIYKYWT